MTFAYFLIELFVLLQSSLYTLDLSALLDVQFANTVSQHRAFLFIPLTGSYVEQTFLILMRSNLSIFSFYGLCF